jgi:hypothetical protein
MECKGIDGVQGHRWGAKALIRCKDTEFKGTDGLKRHPISATTRVVLLGSNLSQDHRVGFQDRRHPASSSS